MIFLRPWSNHDCFFTVPGRPGPEIPKWSNRWSNISSQTATDLTCDSIHQHFIFLCHVHFCRSKFQAIRSCQRLLLIFIDCLWYIETAHVQTIPTRKVISIKSSDGFIRGYFMLQFFYSYDRRLSIFDRTSISVAAIPLHHGFDFDSIPACIICFLSDPESHFNLFPCYYPISARFPLA